MVEGEDRLYWSEVDGAGAGEAFELEEAGARIDLGEVDGREGGARDEYGQDAGMGEVACRLVEGADAAVEGDAVQGEGFVVEEELVEDAEGDLEEGAFVGGLALFGGDEDFVEGVAGWVVEDLLVRWPGGDGGEFVVDDEGSGGACVLQRCVFGEA